MASLEQRIENLFPSKTRKEPNAIAIHKKRKRGPARGSKTDNKPTPIATVAIIFAERRGQWLTHDDIINLINKRFADSTVLKAFKVLSRPLDVLGGYSFIDTEAIKKEGRGSPIIRGRLSEAASEKIFALVTPVKQKPESYSPGLLNGEGRLEMPPLQIGDKYLSPEDIIRLRIQKSGEKETRHLLRMLVNDRPGAEKEAMQKMIGTLAEKQGITFNATNGQFSKGNQVVMPSGKLAEAHAKWKCLHGKEEPYAKATDIADIIKKHHFGPFPLQQHIIADLGLMELASDENSAAYSIAAYIVDSREDAIFPSGRGCAAYSITANIVDSREDDARVHALEERALKGEKEAVDELIQVLSSDNSQYARQDAAYSLGRLHDIRVTEPLIKAMLSDEYSGVRSVAATMIREFGYRHELTIALKDSDSYVRREVATILGKIGDIRAIDPLKEALKDPDIGVQCAAANALGEIGDIRAIDSLVLLLGSEPDSARCAAAAALGNIGGPRAIQAVKKACDDPGTWVCDVSKNALEKIEKKN